MIRNDLEDLLCQKGYHRLQRICFYCFVVVYFSPIKFPHKTRVGMEM